MLYNIWFRIKLVYGSLMFKKDLEKTISKVAESLGYKLVEYYVNEKYKNINVIIYKKEGITVGDCENMTKELFNDIDFYASIEDDYNIVVSSPGAEREFRSINEYKIFEGKEVKILTDSDSKENNVIQGVLKGVENGNNIIVEDGFKIHKIPYIHIKKGKLLFNFTFNREVV